MMLPRLQLKGNRPEAEETVGRFEFWREIWWNDASRVTAERESTRGWRKTDAFLVTAERESTRWFFWQEILMEHWLDTEHRCTTIFNRCTYRFCPLSTLVWNFLYFHTSSLARNYLLILILAIFNCSCSWTPWLIHWLFESKCLYYQKQGEISERCFSSE